MSTPQISTKLILTKIMIFFFTDSSHGGLVCPLGSYLIYTITEIQSK